MAEQSFQTIISLPHRKENNNSFLHFKNRPTIPFYLKQLLLYFESIVESNAVRQNSVCLLSL